MSDEHSLQSPPFSVEQSAGGGSSTPDTKVNNYHAGTAEPTNETLAALGFTDGDETKPALYTNTDHNVDFDYIPTRSPKWRAKEIYKDTTWNVGAGLNLTTLNLAMDEAGKYYIKSDITLTLALADGSHEMLTDQAPHNQESQIVITSASAVVQPVEADYSLSHGTARSSSGTRSTDAAADRTMLQGKYPARIDSMPTGTAGDFVFTSKRELTFRNILIDSTTMNSSQKIEFTNKSEILFDGCSLHGNLALNLKGGSTINASTSKASGRLVTNLETFSADEGSKLYLPASYSTYRLYRASNFSSVFTSSNHRGGHGLTAYTIFTRHNLSVIGSLIDGMESVILASIGVNLISLNSIYDGMDSSQDGLIVSSGFVQGGTNTIRNCNRGLYIATSTTGAWTTHTFTGCSVDVRAQDNANVKMNGTGLNTQPALNTYGNGNSYIKS